MNRKKTMLVTGGAGYIGSAIVKHLSELGYQVVAFDNFSSGQRHKLPSDVVVVEGDTTNELDDDQLFAGHTFTGVIHCAAKKNVSESECQPALYFKTNVVGTLNVLIAMEKYAVPKIVFSSTAAVYAPVDDDVPVTEESRTEPQSVYGRSKLLAEDLIRDFARCGKIQSYTILRYFNVAGDVGLQFKEVDAQGVFPLLAEAIVSDKPFYVTGTDYQTKDGSGVRDYIHLHDLVVAHEKALSNDHKEVINLGTSHGYTVFELIGAFERLLGKSVNYEASPRRPGDLPSMLANVEKARSQLDWQAEKQLDDMVESIIDVYQL